MSAPQRINGVIAATAAVTIERLEIPAGMRLTGHGHDRRNSATWWKEPSTSATAEEPVYPDYANGWDSLGEAYVHPDRRAEAIAAFRRAIAVDPTLAPSRAWLRRLNADER